MAENNKLPKMSALEALAQKMKGEIGKTDQKVDSLSARVDNLAAAGGEPNAITAIKVNGTAQAIADKAVDITVPTKASELANDAKYQTDADVAAAVAAAGHLTRKIVESVDGIDPAAEDADKYIYMVPKTGGGNGGKYDEYMVLDGAVEPVGDWDVDLSGYVQKEDGKGLSANDYTDADKAKLDGLEFATDEEVAAMLAEVFGA